MRNLLHLTLDSGHVRNSPEKEVGRETIDALSPIIGKGKGEIAGWCIQMVHGPATGSAGFTLHNGGLWIASGYMAWTPQGDLAQWGVVCQLHKTTVMKPMCLPWLAVKLMPDAERAPLGVLMEAGDLERCIAWTILKFFGEEISSGGQA